MKPSPAATVVLVRKRAHQDGNSQTETLLLLRNSRLQFMGGTWVFPGGRVDALDYSPQFAGLPQAHADYLAAMNAAVRETREEAGLNIAHDRLIHIAHWTTPPGQSRRFATWFFLCPVEDGSAVVVDDMEILDHQWISPADALKSHEAGKIQLPLPTEYTLKSIASYTCVNDLCKAMKTARIHVFPEHSDDYLPVPGSLRMPQS
jgi:8-oxo-dGTP pyrophosphatase MutT (NUDIX family)